MNIGKKIQRARKLRGMTLRMLGLELGFSYKTSEVRVAQYENSSRMPRAEMLEKIADILKINPKSLDPTPDFEDPEQVMQTFFDLEESGYDIDVRRSCDKVLAVIDGSKIEDQLEEWKEVKSRLKKGQISEKEYDAWKYEWHI